MKLPGHAVCALGLGLALASSLAHGQSVEIPPTELPVNNYVGVREGGIGCACGPYTRSVHHLASGGKGRCSACGADSPYVQQNMSWWEKMLNKCYLTANCSCFGCDGLCRELHYWFGSCGDWYCAPIKYDLISGRPLWEVDKSIIPVYYEPSTIPFPDVIIPPPPPYGPGPGPYMPAPSLPQPRPSPTGRAVPAVAPNHALMPQLEKPAVTSKQAGTSGVTVYRIIPKRPDPAGQGDSVSPASMVETAGPAR
jgi:hypothetical protein